MHLNLNGPANALSVNRDANRVVVAGRNVLKIFAITDTAFVEESNLRIVKASALNLSCQDVIWSPLDDDVIVSASTNGAVVVWNLNKEVKVRTDVTYAAHVRTVNKLAFHPTDQFCMISASQDATIKLFDLRKAEPIAAFENGTDSIRDVQFSWHSGSIFAAADEAGNVKCWDVRNTDRPVKTFTAHGGPVLSLDFHPVSKNWLATGGRDRVIKVWDWTQEKPTVVYSVQTTASVNKVKWRPSRQYHLASCSMVIDCSIHVWDIQRPFIPFATFDKHNDVATGIAWLNDPHVFLSCGKDGLLVKHLFKDAAKPADWASPVGLSLGPNGDIAWAVSTDFAKRQRSRGSVSIRSNASSDLSKIRTSASITSMLRAIDLFSPINTSSLHVAQFKNAKSVISYRGFVQCAQNYVFHSKSVAETCEFNAQVALAANALDVARAWLVLRDILEFNKNNNQEDRRQGSAKGVDSPEYASVDAQRFLDVGAALGVGVRLSAGGSLRELAGGGGAATETETEDDNQTVTTLYNTNATASDATRSRRVTNRASQSVYLRGPGADSFFGDGDFTRVVFATDGGADDAATTKDQPGVWKLQHEAFEPRRDFGHATRASPGNLGDLDHLTTGQTPEHRLLPHLLTPSTPNDESLIAPKPTLIKIAESAGADCPKILPIHCQEIIKDLLYSYVDSGDLQSAVCTLLALGPYSKNLVDEATQQVWYKSYVDLLDRFALWQKAASFIKFNPLPSVHSLSQRSTLFGTACQTCEKSNQRPPWWCAKCLKFTNICSVCNQVVKGLFACCHCCGHGGHLSHVRKWFQSHRECPAGCGHQCEYGED